MSAAAKPVGRLRGVQIAVRLSESEAAIVREAAGLAATPLAWWLRSVLLNAARAQRRRAK